MASPQSPSARRQESPDPASHAANIYDLASNHDVDETDDTDGTYHDDTEERTTDESDDAEFFDPTEDVEADFHGMVLVGNGWSLYDNRV